MSRTSRHRRRPSPTRPSQTRPNRPNHPGAPPWVPTRPAVLRAGNRGWRAVLSTAAARAVLRTSVAVVGLTVGGQLAGAALAVPGDAGAPGRETPAATAPAHASTPEDGARGPAELREARQVRRIVRSEGCWTGAAPAGAALPSRALVTLPGGRPRLVRDTVGYAIWLDGRPGTLHAFCP